MVFYLHNAWGTLLSHYTTVFTKWQFPNDPSQVIQKQIISRYKPKGTRYPAQLAFIQPLPHIVPHLPDRIPHPAVFPSVPMPS
jgi:hypothetical protein